MFYSFQNKIELVLDDHGHPETSMPKFLAKLNAQQQIKLRDCEEGEPEQKTEQQGANKRKGESDPNEQTYSKKLKQQGIKG